MPALRRRLWQRLGAFACVLGAASALALAVQRAQRPSEGPVEVTWDRTACHRCGMLVSDPAFAAQLHTPGGAVFHFDDPGCLLVHLHEAKPEVHAVWLHHQRDDRWLALDESAFVFAESTPMEYGLGVIEAGEAASALSAEQAAQHALRRDAARKGGL